MNHQNASAPPISDVARSSFGVGRGFVALIVLLLCLPPGYAASPGGVFQWRPFLGPFHSVLLHFPIGFVMMAFLVDLFILWGRRVDFQPVISVMLGLSVAATMLTIGLGLMRATGAEYDPQMLSAHRNNGIVVGVLTLGAFVLHWLGFRGSRPTPAKTVLRGAYRVMLLANIGLLTVTGHEGGNLTHGSNYLTKNAPEFVRTLVEMESESPEALVASGNEHETFYLDHVKPVFDTKCLACHGPEKQKGHFRLDQPDLVRKGGESEKPAVVPGDPLASNLVRLILLPPDHDDVMPPAGKSVLTADEVLHIIRWVQQGAHMPGHAPFETPPSTNGP